MAFCWFCLHAKKGYPSRSLHFGAACRAVRMHRWNGRDRNSNFTPSAGEMNDTQRMDPKRKCFVAGTLLQIEKAGSTPQPYHVFLGGWMICREVESVFGTGLGFHPSCPPVWTIFLKVPGFHVRSGNEALLCDIQGIPQVKSTSQHDAVDDKIHFAAL